MTFLCHFCCDFFCVHVLPERPASATLVLTVPFVFRTLLNGCRSLMPPKTGTCHLFLAQFDQISELLISWIPYLNPFSMSCQPRVDFWLEKWNPPEACMLQVHFMNPSVLRLTELLCSSISRSLTRALPCVLLSLSPSSPLFFF